MIAVLSVLDLDQSRDQLRTRFGFVALGRDLLALGDQRILLCTAGREPASMLRLPMDHVAFRVPDADVADAAFGAAGLARHSAFTPDGPRDIDEFWENGVRFVFFAGPDGWPFEFCAIRGAPPAVPAYGHGHYGLRVADLDLAEQDLAALGAVRIASHRIEGNGGAVTVRFLRLGAEVFELFDEPPVSPRSRSGWVGLLDD